MEIIVNGNKIETCAPTLAAYLSENLIAISGVAIAVNGRVVPKSKHGEFALSQGDKITIITATHGG